MLRSDTTLPASAAAPTATPIAVAVQRLSVRYRLPGSDAFFHAVDDVSFALPKGSSLGIVGESGSGKTTLGMALMRLLPPNATVTAGSVRVGNHDVLTASDAELRQLRWKSVSMVFQNSMSALNPVYRVGNQIMDAVQLHEPMGRSAAQERAATLFDLVGISPSRLRAYPHELSGGMKQRAMIALALACNPEVVVADEPTTALDVVIQAQIIDLLRRLREDLGLTLILISHDLGVVAQLADRIAVMYAGQIVEDDLATSILSHPTHPYTRALLDAYPALDVPAGQLRSIPGAPPDLSRVPGGCRFAPRCRYRQAICVDIEPELLEAVQGGLSRCHFRNGLPDVSASDG